MTEIVSIMFFYVYVVVAMETVAVETVAMKQKSINSFRLEITEIIMLCAYETKSKLYSLHVTTYYCFC